MRFDELNLAKPLLHAVTRQGYETATPIQARAIPPVLSGRDVLGCAQTGTGKTAAFALPLLQRLGLNGSRSNGRPKPRALVLCPTRELATQIGDAFVTYGKGLNVREVVIFGGVSQYRQVQKLRQGAEVIIATPGRLLDLINQGHVDLSGIEALVLDEADRMLDMGFIADIRKIAALTPSKRQTLLFSATMPPAIRSLADAMLREPAVVKIAPESATVDSVEQSVYFVERSNKPTLLAELVRDLPMDRAIVFTRTKHGADKVVRQLRRDGIAAEAIHGNKSQPQRQRSLASFRDGKVAALVATDIASRGIDVDGITHVVNYDLTHEPATYVHRIGRTARAGASGTAISFCDREEVGNLRAIEKMLREAIPVCETHGPEPDWAAGAGVASPQRRSSRAGTNARAGGSNRRSNRGSSHPRARKPGGRARQTSTRRRTNR